MMFRAFLVIIALAVIGVHSAATSECEKDASSYQCLIEKDRSASEPFEATERVRKDKASVDMIVAKVEQLVNEWCCSATGNGLYQTHGDKDVMNFVFSMLSQTLARNGQHYGSQLVTEFLTERGTPDGFSCAAIEQNSPEHFGDLMESVLVLKAKVHDWLAGNEVESTEILNFLIPQVRTLFGRWGIARLLALKGDSMVPPEEIPLAVLPLLDGDDDSAEERCTAAGQLYIMYREAGKATQAKAHVAPRVYAATQKLLDECYQNGRISAKPSSFGETLLDSDREEQARELFDLAVQRGALCNPFQRPEMLHRKDLSALPVWSLESYPESVLRGFLGIQDLIADTVRKDTFLFSNDTETMQMFVSGGTWERTIIYAAHQWQEYNCMQFGEDGCGKLKKLVDVITDSNDAYATQCNGSLALDIWRLSSNFTTQRTTGSSNIVLQLLMPVVGRGHSLLVNVGEEAVKVDEGEIVLMDDSFENTLKVEVEDESAGERKPLIVLHAQLCHPEFHDRALELPGKKCRQIHRG